MDLSLSFFIRIVVVSSLMFFGQNRQLFIEKIKKVFPTLLQIALAGNVKKNKNKNNNPLKYVVH